METKGRSGGGGSVFIGSAVDEFAAAGKNSAGLEAEPPLATSGKTVKFTSAATT